MDAIDFIPGNDRDVPGACRYAAGAAALPGHRAERVMVTAPVPLERGFAPIAEISRGGGRRLTAFRERAPR